MLKKYECVIDYQDGKWCVGIVDTIEGWRSRALEWADYDGNDELYKEVNELDPTEVMDFISDVWQVGFKEFI